MVKGILLFLLVMVLIGWIGGFLTGRARRGRK
jgi:hypothetical protein